MHLVIQEDEQIPNKNQLHKQINTKKWYLGTPLSGCWKLSLTRKSWKPSKKNNTMHPGVHWLEWQVLPIRDKGRQKTLQHTFKVPTRNLFTQFMISLAANMPHRKPGSELSSSSHKTSRTTDSRYLRSPFVPPHLSQQKVAWALRSLLSYSNSSLTSLSAPGGPLNTVCLTSPPMLSKNTDHIILLRKSLMTPHGTQNKIQTL